eukprot:2454351-Rhodomonas_salina.2
MKKKTAESSSKATTPTKDASSDDKDSDEEKAPKKVTKKQKTTAPCVELLAHRNSELDDTGGRFGEGDEGRQQGRQSEEACVILHHFLQREAPGTDVRPLFRSPLVNLTQRSLTDSLALFFCACSDSQTVLCALH